MEEQREALPAHLKICWYFLIFFNVSPALGWRVHGYLKPAEIRPRETKRR